VRWAFPSNPAEILERYLRGKTAHLETIAKK